MQVAPPATRSLESIVNVYALAGPHLADVESAGFSLEKIVSFYALIEDVVSFVLWSEFGIRSAGRIDCSRLRRLILHARVNDGDHSNPLLFQFVGKRLWIGE